MVEVERGLFDQAMEGLQRLEQVGTGRGRVSQCYTVGTSRGSITGPDTAMA